MRSKALFALLFWITGTAAAATHTHDAGHALAPAFDGKDALAQSQAAAGRTLDDAVLRGTDGREVRLASFRGKPLAISLIYTSCYHICPTTTQHLAKIAARAWAALGDASFNVVTIGFDARNDTPDAMREFARAQGVDVPYWQFLSADAATIEHLARNLGFVFTPTPHGFDHLIQTTLVDAQGRIYRQVYGMDFDSPALVEPLKELALGGTHHAGVLAGTWTRVRLFCTTYDPSTGAYRFDYSLFVGMIIGALSLAAVGTYLLLEWRRQRAAQGA